MEINKKIENLKEYLKNKKCILAYSAGSDSNLLAYILSQVSPNSLLVTVDNKLFSEEFITYSQRQAQKYKLKHKIIKLNFLENEEITRNDSMRCYHCRNLMYQSITQLDEYDEYDYFIEGTNITDLLEDRPGLLIKDKYNMTSPLIECRITKQDVYDMIEYLNLEYSSNTTCLATRIKTDEKTTKDKLDIIEKSEKLIRKYVNQENIRLRTDNKTAIISVDNPYEILDKKLLNTLEKKLKRFGFKKIYLDITGYEKTTLKYLTDKENNYYYQLPYTIDINMTADNLEKSREFNETINKEDERISYSNIIINKNGKITINDEKNFNETLYDILPFIQRKL